MSIVAERPQAGLDVGKDRLECSLDGGRPFGAPNTEAGCRLLAGRLPAGTVVHLECTGGYERLALRVLSELGFEVRAHDPLRARRMCEARGRKAKSDPLDARELSLGGRLLEPRAPKSPGRQALCDLSRAAASLKERAGQLRRHAAMPELDPRAARALSQGAEALCAQARRLEKEFAKRVRSSDLGGRYELALGVPGVGPCLARTLVCELPEDLDAFTDAQLCAYAGVAPLEDSSGKRQGRARVARGNARLKAALYMPAVSLLRQPWAKDLYARLRAKGKAHQQAAVALMRRLLLRVLAVLRRGTPWQDEPPRRPQPETEP